MPSPEALAAVKEIHSVQWHGMTHDQMLESGANIIDRLTEVYRDELGALRAALIASNRQNAELREVLEREANDHYTHPDAWPAHITALLVDPLEADRKKAQEYLSGKRDHELLMPEELSVEEHRRQIGDPRL